MQESKASRIIKLEDIVLPPTKLLLSPLNGVTGFCYGDKDIKIWSLETGKVLLKLNIEKDAGLVKKVKVYLTQRQDILVTYQCDEIGKIVLFDSRNGQTIRRAETPSYQKKITLLSDGKIILSSQRDKQVYIWNPYSDNPTLDTIAVPPCHSGQFLSAVYAYSKDTFIIVVHFTGFFFYKIGEATPYLILDHNTSLSDVFRSETSMLILQDGSIFFRCGMKEEDLIRYHPITKELKRGKCSISRIVKMILSPDGNIVMNGGTNFCRDFERIIIYDPVIMEVKLETKSPMLSVPNERLTSTRINKMAMLPNGKLSSSHFLQYGKETMFSVTVITNVETGEHEQIIKMKDELSLAAMIGDIAFIR